MPLLLLTNDSGYDSSLPEGDRRATMKIGIDTYSYHRLLGEVRAGERPSAGRFANGSLDAIAHARAAGAELVSLETAFLAVPPDAGALRAAAGAGLELAIAWGHPDGLAWGLDPAAPGELLAWIATAPALRARILRLVVASPRVARPRRWLEPVVPALEAALYLARRHRVRLCVENHADLTVEDLLVLGERLPALDVCLDTANALRVGDDPVEATRRLRERVAMVHLKDCEAGDGRDPVAGPASVPYGTGAVDVEGVLRALGDRLDGLPVCVELAQLPQGAVDERALVAEDVAWLRRWRATRRIEVDERRSRWAS
jgi:sugar phosphate isomerase/epimerase